jgi:hypothetical protein
MLVFIRSVCSDLPNLTIPVKPLVTEPLCLPRLALADAEFQLRIALIALTMVSSGNDLARWR